ncbi:MAG: bifunctional serine/threonine-protein kinase/formylglycine-generating enzyme family protein [Verrucomicrobia bacterium]|nr:bifunctional serine/threonine-protein kinase/formylglycine-generating enzyme family protein [Verrucomicrobiota bacterium]
MPKHRHPQNALPSNPVWQIPARGSRNKRARRPEPAFGKDQRLDLAIGSIRPGDHLENRFEIMERIGAGGMSLVYRALDLNRGEEVAIKFLSPTLLQEPGAVKNFVNEARIASLLTHPNILKVYEVHLNQGVHFLHMELLKGMNLREWMKQKSFETSQITLDQVLPILLSICEALKYAHETTVHRDLKPENIGISDSGEIKLMDFGLARLLIQPDSTLYRETVNQISAGTPYYLAPELLSHNQAVDGRADQFSLAVVAYEALTGELPLGLATPLAERRPDLPLRFASAIDRALSHRPTDRFETIADFADELQRSKLPEGFATRLRRRAVRAPLALKLFVLVTLSAALAYPLLRMRDRGLTIRQARIEQTGRAIDDAELRLSRLNELAPEADLAKSILVRRLEIESAALNVSGANFSQQTRVITVSNQLNVASAVWDWVAPQITSQRVFIKPNELIQAARSKKRAHRFDDAYHLLVQFREEAVEIATRLTHVKSALGAKDSVSRLLAAKLNIESGEPAPATLKIQETLKSALEKIEREDWETADIQFHEIKRDLTSDLDAQFSAAQQRFQLNRSRWIGLFPEDLGPPDLRFLADTEAMNGRAIELHRSEQYDRAIRELVSASEIYERWAEDVASLRVRTEPSWSEARFKLEALGMRFIRVGSVYWSVWETRIMDFARWLADNMEFYSEVQDSIKMTRNGFGPTHPITGLSRRVTSSMASWMGDKMILQARPYGKLPTQQHWVELHDLGEIHREYKFGIFPNQSIQRIEILRDYYSDTNINASAHIKPVAMKAPSGAGLFDLSGNAWEWSSSTVQLDVEESFNEEPLKWILHGGGKFGEHTFHENEPPRTNSVYVPRMDSIGSRIVLIPNRALDDQSGWNAR